MRCEKCGEEMEVEVMPVNGTPTNIYTCKKCGEMRIGDD